MLAPILVHTAEEVWNAMKFKSDEAQSVHLATMPDVDDSIDLEADQANWQKLMELRDEVLRVLEPLRQEKKIASNQEASVTINCDEQWAAILNDFGLEQFAALCIVSEIKVQKSADQMTVAPQKSSHQKCQRCWNYWPSVAANPEHADLCERCIEVITTA